MGDIKIEKNIPIPRKGKQKYPFSKMEIGDSFFLENSTIGKVAAEAYREKKATNRMYVARSIDGGVRIWRVE